MARRVLVPSRLNLLISTIPVLLRVKDDAVLYKVPNAPAIVALQVLTIVSSRLHGDAAVCDWLGVGKTQHVANARDVP